MDRLRQELELFEMLDEPGKEASERFSIAQVLHEHPKPYRPFQTTTQNCPRKPAKGKLASLVRRVQGADPKRWARRLEERISEGDESVTLLQKQAAKHALQ